MRRDAVKTNKFLILIGIIICLFTITSYAQNAADMYFHEGVKSYLEGDLKTAKEHLENALKENPSHQNAQKVLKEVAAELGALAPSSAVSAPVTPAATAVSSSALPPSAPEDYTILSPFELKSASAPSTGVKYIKSVNAYTENNQLKVLISANAEVNYIASKIYNPAMIIVDIPNTENRLPRKALNINKGNIIRVRHSQYKRLPLNVSRFVVDLKKWSAEYEIKKVQNGILVTILNPGLTEEELLALTEPAASKVIYGVEDGVAKASLEQKILSIEKGAVQRKLAVGNSDEIEISLAGPDGRVYGGETLTARVVKGGITFNGVKEKELKTNIRGRIIIPPFKLPEKAEDNVIEFTHGELKVRAVITVMPGEVYNIVKVFGDNQEGLVGTKLKDSLVVEVRDIYGNPVPGEKVVFNIVSGQGSIYPELGIRRSQRIITTGSDGRARLDYVQLGILKGSQLVKASVFIDEAYSRPHSIIVTSSGDISDAIQALVVDDGIGKDEFVLNIFKVDKIDPVSMETEIRKQVTIDGFVSVYPQTKTVYYRDKNLNEALLNDIFPDIKFEKIASKMVKSVVFSSYAKPRIVSVDFREADVRDVVRTLAELSNWNVSFPVDFEGAVTVHLINVPAMVALETILAPLAYTPFLNQNNIIEIMRLEDFEDREMASLVTEVIYLQYRKANEIEELIKKLFIDERSAAARRTAPQSFQLTGEAQFAADDFTNSLTVVTHKRNMEIIKGLIQKLDMPSVSGREETIEIYPLTHKTAADFKALLESVLEDRDEKRQIGFVEAVGEGIAPLIGNVYFEADEKLNALIAVTSAQNQKLLAGIIKKFDVSNLGMHIINLKNISSDVMLKLLNQFHESDDEGQARIIVIDDKNILLVGPSSSVNYLKDLAFKLDVKELDIPYAQPVVFRPNVDPSKIEVVAGTLKELFPNVVIIIPPKEQREFEAGTAANPRIITQEVSSDFFVVLTDNAVELDEIRRIVQHMTEPEWANRDVKVHIYRPRYAPPSNIKYVFQQYLVSVEGIGMLLDNDIEGTLTLITEPEYIDVLIRKVTELDRAELSRNVESQQLKVYKLKNAEVEGVYEIVNNLLGENAFTSQDKNTNSLIVWAEPINLRKVDDILKDIDRPKSLKVISLQYASSKAVITNLNALNLLSAAGSMKEDGRTNSIVVYDIPPVIERIEKIIKGLDVSQSQTGESTRIFYLSNAKASELVTVLNQVVAATRGEGELETILGKVAADPRTNSLVVTSPPQSAKMLSDLIRQLDVKSPQVLIKTVILEFALDESSQMGVQWSWNKAGFDNEIRTVGLGGGGLMATLTSSQFRLALEALESTNRTEVLSNPHVLTLNNQEANIVIGTTRQQRKFVYNAEGVITGEEFTDKSADLDLTITPQIGADRSVQLNFELDLEEFIPVSGTSDELPTNTRKLSSSIIVQDGQTLVLGGIIKNKQDGLADKTPFLGDLPAIGKFFRKETGRKEKTELMIFITPEVITNIAEATQATKGVAADLYQLTPLPVNVNLSSFEELIKLPGLGYDDERLKSILANRIIYYRATYGPFQSLEEIKFVPGIDDDMFLNMFARLAYKVDPNTASIEEMMRLKGVDLRIAQNIIDRRTTALFRNASEVKEAFIRAGLMREVYEAYLEDIIEFVTTHAFPHDEQYSQTKPILTERTEKIIEAQTARPADRVEKTVPEEIVIKDPEIKMPQSPEPQSDGKLDLNTATEAQLRALGLSEMDAKLIIAYRQRYGRYTRASDLLKVPGISRATYDLIKDKVKGDINNSNAEVNNSLPVIKTPAVLEEPPLIENSMVPPLPSAAKNINTAGVNDFVISGIDDYKAKLIVAYRHTYGEFDSFNDLEQVPGLNDDDIKIIKSNFGLK